MTLAPARPTSTPSAPDGVEPSVTAVVITRRDARGLAALLDAVLDQSLPPDAVLVLDRSGGAAIPASDSGDDDPTDHHVSGDHVTLDHSAVTVAGVVDRARRRHSVPVTVLPVDPRTPARTAAHR